jgi:hypothetical protein
MDPMDDNPITDHFVGNDVVQRRDDQLASSGLPADPASVRHRAEALYLFVDTLRNSGGSRRVVLPDMQNDAAQIVSREIRPSNIMRH